MAYDRNFGIGAAGDLLWQRDLPADLANFKRLTTSKSVIMGRKTFESIGRPLPNRQNIVISRRGPVGAEGANTVASLESAYSMAQFEIMIIGGGEIYQLAFAEVDRIYATEVDAEFPEATVFFPKISHDDWQEIAREHYKADQNNKYDFDFVTYQRIEK